MLRLPVALRSMLSRPLSSRLRGRTRFFEEAFELRQWRLCRPLGPTTARSWRRAPFSGALERFWAGLSIPV